MSKKNFIMFFSLSLLITFSIFYYHTVARAVNIDSSVSAVSASDLENAGYKNVSQAVPANGRFNGPALYFTVDDKTSLPSEAVNIVMVYDGVYSNGISEAALFTYGNNSHAFTISGATAKEGTMNDGRIAINFVKNNHYTVIIGPNQQKVETLALEMADKNK